jgi:hypothetical protein
VRAAPRIEARGTDFSTVIEVVASMVARESADQMTADHSSDAQTPPLWELLDQVHDRETFFRFVWALSADWEDEKAKLAANPEDLQGGPEPNGWFNNPGDGFLDGALRWPETMARLGEFGEEPSWQQFANFLCAGKIYE